MDAFNLTNTIKIGDGQPLVVLAGPCVAESLDICRTIAEKAAAASVSPMSSKPPSTRPTAPPSTPSAATGWKKGWRFSPPSRRSSAALS